MNIYVVTATIDGIALDAGDEIATFDGPVCCGLVVLTQPISLSNSNTFASIAASRKDEGLSNGYTVGDPITYKFWDSSKNQEFSSIDAVYLDLSGNTIAAPTYTPAGSAIVKLSFTTPVNHPPVSNAGPDQTVNEGSIVTLDGSASSDADGNPLTYNWTAPAGITLSSTTAVKPTFTAPEVTTDTPYIFSLVVNDGTINSNVDQVVITVKNVNKIPIANAGPDQSVNEGTTVTLDGTASSDPDGDSITYNWTAPTGITLSSATASKPTFTAPEVMTNTNYTFSLLVNDGKANSTADQVIITVNHVNKPPVANAGPDATVTERKICQLDGSLSSDPENNPLTYKWTAPAGITLSSTTEAKPTFTAPVVSSNTPYTFSLIVNDGTLDSPADQVVITVVPNLPPTANAGPDQTVNEGDLTTLDGSASSDPNNDPLTYLWTAPAGITLSSTTVAKPTFKAPSVQSDTPYKFSLVVNDGFSDSPVDEVTVTVKHVSKAPVANAGPDQSVNENSLCTLDGSASFDPDGNALTYKWTAPSGITLSSTTVANPTFTAPNANANASYTFTLVVNNGKLDSPADQVIISVKHENRAPIANAGANQTVNEGAVVTLDGSASSDPDNNQLTYQWTAPAGVLLSSPTAKKPTFIAPEVSTDTYFTFSLIVNDGTVNSDKSQVIVIVKQVKKAPVYISSKFFNAVPGRPFQILLEAMDSEKIPVTFSIGNLPSFLTLTPQSSTSALLSGTFTSQNIGDNLLILNLSDGVLSSGDTINIMVYEAIQSLYVKNPIQNISVEKMAPDQKIDLTAIFADDNPNDVISYSISENSNNQVVNANISGSELTLSFSTVNVGSSEISVLASANGKSAQSTFKVEVTFPVGINQLIDDEKVEVYPNPSDGDIYLKFDQVPKAGSVVSVYNLTGSVIMEKMITNKLENLNIKGNSPGLYFIQIEQKTPKTFKIILQ